MVDAPVPPRRERRAPHAGRRVGYVMVMGAATLFAVNGTVSKVVLESGVTSLASPRRAARARSSGSGLIVLVTRPQSLRATRRELAFLAVFGVCGVAFVQLFYFAAIERLEIGVSLLIQYTAPLLVALWARFVFKEHVRRRVWAALALAFVGLSVMVDVWGGVPLEHARRRAVLHLRVHVRRRTSCSPSTPSDGATRSRCSSTAFSSRASSGLSSNPGGASRRGELAETISLLGNLSGTELPAWVLMLAIVVVGTIVPFILMVGSLQHLPATTVGMVAMLEPVLGALVAYLWLDESLAAQQLVGGAIVLAAIFLAQTSRD